MPWPMFERIWQQEFAMHDMMKIFGLDPAEVVRLDGGQTYGELKANCVACRHADLCRAWRFGLNDEPSPQEYCRNYNALRSLTAFEVWEQ